MGMWPGLLMRFQSQVYGCLSMSRLTELLQNCPGSNSQLNWQGMACLYLCTMGLTRTSEYVTILLTCRSSTWLNELKIIIRAAGWPLFSCWSREEPGLCGVQSLAQSLVKSFGWFDDFGWGGQWPKTPVNSLHYAVFPHIKFKLVHMFQ